LIAVFLFSSSGSGLKKIVGPPFCKQQ